MTKAKSNFCKTLVALIIGLALAITAFGGFSLINARAAGEEEGGADLPQGQLSADTIYAGLQGYKDTSGKNVMYTDKWNVNRTIVTSKYGNLKKYGFELTKAEAGKNYRFDNQAASGEMRDCGVIATYYLKMTTACPTLNMALWGLYNITDDNDNNVGTRDEMLVFFSGQDNYKSDGYRDPYNNYETIGIKGRGDTSCFDVNADNLTGSGNFSITPKKVGKAAYVVQNKGVASWSTVTSNTHFVMILEVVEPETVAYESFTLPATAAGFVNDATPDPLCINTGITTTATVGNVQAYAGDKANFLTKMKFQLKNGDEVYHGNLHNGKYTIDINRNVDGNVVFYLKENGNAYVWQEGDKFIIEQGWQMVAYDEYGNIIYQDKEGTEKELTLDRTYTWVYHYDANSVTGHFGYETNAFSGIAIESVEETENGNIIVENGSNATLTAIGLAGGTCPADQDYEVDGHKVNEVTWASSDANIATVDANGVVTAKAVGSVTITATSVIDNTKTATVSVEVIPADAITKVEVSGKNSVDIEKTTQLTATIEGGSQAQSAATVVWSSSNESVATVDANGLVTAVGKGTATITASATSSSTTTAVTGSYDVTVTLPSGYATGVTLSASKNTLEIGGTVNVTATLVGSDDVSESIDVEITYTSSDANIATVDANGKVTAVSAGKVTITVTVSSNNSKDVTDTIEITVNAANNGGDDEQEDNKKSGCGSNVIGTTSVIAGIALMMAAFVLIGKKRKENN